MAQRAAAVLFFMVSFFSIALCQNAWKEELHCYNCTFGQPCLEKSLVTCKDGERCTTMKGDSDYKVHESILGKGCVPSQKCASQERITHSSNPFRVTYSCCSTNYCNGGIVGASHASDIHLPMLFGATVLAILFASLS